MEAELKATLNWFKNPVSQVSAHVVIAFDGTLYSIVDDGLLAWHGGFESNRDYLGLEFVQPRPGDSISDAQYRTAAWWLKRMSTRYGFALVAETLPEHRETPQGISSGKSDIGPPFDLARILAFL